MLHLYLSHSLSFGIIKVRKSLNAFNAYAISIIESSKLGYFTYCKWGLRTKQTKQIDGNSLEQLIYTLKVRPELYKQRYNENRLATK